MALFDGKYLPWTALPCEVRDGRVRLKSAYGRIYNVMDYDGYSGKPALYSIFAEIREDRPQDIAGFCSEFGDLGLEYTSIYRRAGSGSGKGESIDDIRREILRMKNILSILAAIGLNDKPRVFAQLYELNKLAFDVDLEDLNEIEEEIREVVFASDGSNIVLGRIADELNLFLQDINPALTVNYETGLLTNGWNIDSLIAGMYFMLFIDISKGKYVKHCENETCGRFFPTPADKMNTKYCCADCARAQANRQYRRREKEKRQGKIQ